MDYLTTSTTGVSTLTHEYFHSELVIGLVAPVGAETSVAKECLEESLRLAGYQVKHVKVSEDVICLFRNFDVEEIDRFQRYRDLMNAGNECRKDADDCEILAKGVAFYISNYREQMKSENKTHDPSLSRTAFIVDSLKRPEEVDLLRIVYPGGFLLIGVHESKERRRKHLANDSGMSMEHADILIETDQDETADEFGQRVNDTFHLADFFVELTGNRDRVRCESRRIIELCFGNPFITPTFDEMAMFQAFSAALRSADLSRQVGAVVARNRQILATGANDSPKFGGGLYWSERDPESGCFEDEPLGRDYLRRVNDIDGTILEGCDSNRVEQRRILKALAERLHANIDGRGMDIDYFMSLLDHEEIQGLTEYGRVVHAEMEALLSCARAGISTLDAELFSTTFPCHNCAKHIIAAGISRVVYVEPYSKSRAEEYHTDSIRLAGQSGEKCNDRVVFEPFVGVGPRRFFSLFSMKIGASYNLRRKKKLTGEKLAWNLRTARLRLQMKPLSYLQFEKLAAGEFGSKMHGEAQDA